MPGIEAEEIELDLKDDILSLSAEKGSKKYRKEVLLPTVCDADQMSLSSKNGIVEIKCMRHLNPS
jgi:HSP20 family protein